MSKYIDADELLKEASKDGAYGYVSAEQIADFPTADVVEVRHGRWVKDEFGSRCGACGLYAYRDKFDKPWESPYCPNCGASMRSIDDEVADLPMEAYYNKDWKMDEVEE